MVLITQTDQGFTSKWIQGLCICLISTIYFEERLQLLQVLILHWIPQINILNLQLLFFGRLIVSAHFLHLSSILILKTSKKISIAPMLRIPNTVETSVQLWSPNKIIRAYLIPLSSCLVHRIELHPWSSLDTHFQISSQQLGRSAHLLPPSMIKLLSNTNNSLVLLNVLLAHHLRASLLHHLAPWNLWLFHRGTPFGLRVLVVAGVMFVLAGIHDFYLFGYF